MTTSGLLVIILGIAWWAIQAAIQAQAKKQQQQKAMDAAQKRVTRSQSGASAAPGARSNMGRAGAGSSGPPPVVGHVDGDHSGKATARQTLAARRQAQLEELRRRRSARESGAAVPSKPLSARSSGGAAPTTAFNAPSSSMSPASLGAPGQMTPFAPATSRVGQSSATPPHGRTSGAPLSRSVTGRQHTRGADSKQATRKSERSAHRASADSHRVADARPKKPVDKRQSGIIGQAQPTKVAEVSGVARRLGLTSRQALRRAVILREVFDEPVSLRRQQV